MTENETHDETRQSINIESPEQETSEPSFRERVEERLTLRDKTKARIIVAILFIVFTILLIRDTAVLFTH